MKRSATLFVLSLGLVPAAAFAQTAGTGAAAAGTVGIDARVTPVCILGDPNPALINLGLLTASAGPRTGKIAVIAPRTIALPASFCNFAGSVVRIDTRALIAADGAAPQSGFARAVNFTAAASNWASGASTATTSALRDGTAPAASGTGATQPLPQIADITVTLSNFTTPGDQFLVAGNYSGTVVVTLGPAAFAAD